MEMKYDRVIQGTFIDRPNRFIANVRIKGEGDVSDPVVRCHVKNTGRCGEILIPGARVILSESDNPDRATRFDLVAAYKGDLLINIDSQAPNKAFREFLLGSDLLPEGSIIRPEYTHGDSRFDFHADTPDGEVFIEVKGVTLEHEGLCSFPDAPTERGVKHLRGLMRCIEEGHSAWAVFIVQMRGMGSFTPNYATHEEFGRVLEEAEGKGVRVLVLQCDVTEDSMTVVDDRLPHSYSSDAATTP